MEWTLKIIIDGYYIRGKTFFSFNATYKNLKYFTKYRQIMMVYSLTNTDTAISL